LPGGNSGYGVLLRMVLMCRAVLPGGNSGYGVLLRMVLMCRVIARSCVFFCLVRVVDVFVVQVFIFGFFKVKSHFLRMTMACGMRCRKEVPISKSKVF